MDLSGWLGRREPTIALPYDRSCPVLYTKDDYLNGYTGEFLIALASAGTIDLRAIVAGHLWPGADRDDTLRGHAGYSERARKSGMRNVPDVLEGSFAALHRPASGRIEDTTPLDSPGARRLVEEARRATPERPLVVVAGGHVTTEASAWLLDPSIGDRVVVSAALGSFEDMWDYNGFMDAWASYIVLTKLRYVQFPPGMSPARVPKRRFRRLPPSELREWLITKRAPWTDLPGGIDVDGAPAISLVAPDYVRRAHRVRFARWQDKTLQGIPGMTVVAIPVFENDPEGSAIVVTEARQRVATRAFWRAFCNPQAWMAQARA